MPDRKPRARIRAQIAWGKVSAAAAATCHLNLLRPLWRWHRAVCHGCWLLVGAVENGPVAPVATPLRGELLSPPLDPADFPFLTTRHALGR